MVCLLSQNGGGINDLTTYHARQEVFDRITHVATWLKDNGFRPGDHIALNMMNSVEFIELTLAAVCAGLWVVPINWHLKDVEIAHIIRDSEARAVLLDSGSTIDLVIIQQIQCDQHWWQSVLNKPKQMLLPEDSAGGVMLYTSGTTGKPKGVKRAGPTTIGELLTNWALVGQRLGLNGSGSHLVTGPLYHAAPLFYALYDFLNGAELVVMPKWDATGALRCIEKYQIAHTHWVPTMFNRVLAIPQHDRTLYNLSSLSLVLHGAAPISTEVKKSIIEWWGPVLVEYWGGSESGVCTSISSEDWLLHPGSVGRPVSGFMIKAFGINGEELPANTEGLLGIHNINCPKAFTYWRDEDKTADAFIVPGWFSLGDIGYVDPNGYVYLTDRKSQMIISGGVNIYPAEIERILTSHPWVQDACVFGIPNAEWGEEVKAAIQLIPGIAAEDATRKCLADHCAKHLANYKRPKTFDFHQALPRTDAGKLYTRILRDPYWENMNRKI